MVQKAVSLPSGTYLHVNQTNTEMIHQPGCSLMGCSWVSWLNLDLFYPSNFVWTSIDIITHEKWWILNLNTLKKQNMTSNWGSRIYLERKIKVSHALVLFLIYKTLATLNVYYCFKSSLEPNSATSWSSYWEMFLFMMSMQGPSKRSKAWMSITGRKKNPILIHVTDIFVFLHFTWYTCVRLLHHSSHSHVWKKYVFTDLKPSHTENSLFPQAWSSKYIATRCC